jgi:hypothetical protein
MNKPNLSRPPIKKAQENPKKISKSAKTKTSALPIDLGESVTPATLEKPKESVILTINSTNTEIRDYLNENIKNIHTKITILQNSKNQSEKRIIHHLMGHRNLLDLIKSCILSLNIRINNQITQEKIHTARVAFIHNIIAIASLINPQNLIPVNLNDNEKFAIARLKQHVFFKNKELQKTALYLTNWNEFKQACIIIHNIVPEFPLADELFPQQKEPISPNIEKKTITNEKQLQPKIIGEKSQYLPEIISYKPGSEQINIPYTSKLPDIKPIFNNSPKQQTTTTPKKSEPNFFQRLTQQMDSFINDLWNTFREYFKDYL